MRDAKIVKRTMYLVLGLKGREHWKELDAPRLYTQKPVLMRGEIAIRVDLEVPMALFEEFIPAATLMLPTDYQAGRADVEIEVPEGIDLSTNPKLRLVAFDPEEEETEE